MHKKIINHVHMAPGVNIPIELNLYNAGYKAGYK